MKGTTFQNGVEYKVTIEGESWAQGSELKGTIEAVVRNAGASEPRLKVMLVDAEEKKVKAKKEDAFEVLDTQSFEKSPTAWKFNLPLNARVTDKSGNLYLLYGNAESSDPHTLGQLKLNIIPHLHLQDFLEVLKIHFRFVPKSISAGKENTVDAKFDGPDSREWTSLEYLLVTLTMTENSIYTNFQFCKTHIDTTAGSMTSKMASKTVKQNFEREYLLKDFVHEFNSRLNKEAITASIEQVIDEYQSVGWLQ